MNIIIIAIAGLITLVSLLGNLYILITVLRGAYTIRKKDNKKSKKKKK
jgi:hypothetical protein